MSIKNVIPMWLRYRIMDLRGRGVYSDFADEFKCIFIHIPKTAGTSVSRTLFNRGSRHVAYFEYEKANRRKFNQYFKFSFVRNPWDRLVSTFFYLKRGGMGHMDKHWAEQNLAAFDDFESFVHNWVTKKNVWSWVHFVPQHHFICDDKLNVKMDFVGRMECIQSDFSHVAEKIDSPAQLVRTNVGSHDNYRDYYDAETRKIVADVYEKDIALFGYQFDSVR